MPTPTRRRLWQNAVGPILPTEVTNQLAWFDVTDITKLFTDAGITQVSADGNSVGRFVDKFGLGNNVNQVGAGTLKPTYKTGIQNGLPGLLYDAGDFLDSTVTASSWPITILGVARTSNTIGTLRGLVSLRIATTFGSRIGFPITDALTGVVDTPTTVLTGPVIPANTTFMFGLRVDSSTITVIKNGVMTSTVHAASAVSRIFSLGKLNTNSTVSLWDGHLFEVIMYSAAHSNQTIAGLTTYLRNKWRW